jgi:hypothetical protein
MQLDMQDRQGSTLLLMNSLDQLENGSAEIFNSPLGDEVRPQEVSLDCCWNLIEGPHKLG